MKVRLETLNVTDKDRAAISNHYGINGLASREDVQDFVTSTINAFLEEFNWELDINVESTIAKMYEDES